jgi:hypothetical protein
MDERKELGYFCYSDVGAYYDIALGILFIDFMYSFHHSCISLLHLLKTKNRDTRTSLSRHDYYTSLSILLMCIIVCLIRFVFLVDWINGTLPNILLFGIIAHRILLRVGQIILMICFLNIVLIWESYFSSLRVSRIDDLLMSRSRGFRLMIVTSAILLLGATGEAIMATNQTSNTNYFILNIIFGCFSVTLTVAGFFYMSRLHRIQKSMIAPASPSHEISRSQKPILISRFSSAGSRSLDTRSIPTIRSWCMSIIMGNRDHDDDASTTATTRILKDIKWICIIPFTLNACAVWGATSLCYQPHVILFTFLLPVHLCVSIHDDMMPHAEHERHIYRKASYLSSPSSSLVHPSICRRQLQSIF